MRLDLGLNDLTATYWNQIGIKKQSDCSSTTHSKLHIPMRMVLTILISDTIIRITLPTCRASLIKYKNLTFLVGFLEGKLRWNFNWINGNFIHCETIIKRESSLLSFLEHLTKWVMNHLYDWVCWILIMLSHKRSMKSFISDMSTIHKYNDNFVFRSEQFYGSFIGIIRHIWKWISTTSVAGYKEHSYINPIKCAKVRIPNMKNAIHFNV